MGRRQLRCLLPSRSARPEPDLSGHRQPRRRRLYVDDGLWRARRRPLQQSDRRDHQRPHAGFRRRRQLRVHPEPRPATRHVAQARPRRRPRADPRLSHRTRHRAAHAMADRGDRPAHAQVRQPRGFGPATPRGAHLAARADVVPAHPDPTAQPDRRAVPGTAARLRLVGGRCRVCDGCLRPRTAPGPGDRRHVTGVRVLEPVPMESVPAHLRLHLRTRHHQRRARPLSSRTDPGES